jgi:hypothetical protein
MECIIPKEYWAKLVLMGVFTSDQFELMEQVFRQVCLSCKIGISDKERRQTLALGILRSMRWAKIEAELHALGNSIDQEIFISFASHMRDC